MSVDKSLKLNYEKRKNNELFKSFQKETLTNLSGVQNYIPIYNKFFDLNETNYNSINLNHEWYITKVEKQTDYNLYKCDIKHSKKDKIKSKNVFFKMAPLLDPFKFIIGKYDISNPILFNLPKYNSTGAEVYEKILDQNNTAYVDGLFTYLTSLLKTNYHFDHGVEFYGSFLGIKNNFKFNIFDDIEYVTKSDYFNKNKNILFKIEDENDILREYCDDNNKKLKPIVIQHENTLNISAKSINNDMFENVFDDVESEQESGKPLQEENHYSLDTLKEFSIDLSNILSKEEMRNNSKKSVASCSSGSSCSSRTSYTSNNDSTGDGGDGNYMRKIGSTSSFNSGKHLSDNMSEDENESEEISDYDEDEYVYVILDKFPIQTICMENCENTFDDLIANEELNEKEWFSALMQIIMMLITYQKVFSFTHNDLHTNNIMYNTTEKKYLYYRYNHKYYKVPTYGRIYKIIDFGRGIYKYNGKQFFSDSFKPGEDASTQYNCEPYFNTKKPRLDPNYSFDLCRLACSIWDYIIDDMDEVSDLEKCSPLVKLIVEWCLDDNGINILYKNNGQERYPDFKLYKMIARNVHNHPPNVQLCRKEFSKYCVESIPGDEKIMNIDEMNVCS